MAANQHRGEIDIKLAGQTRTLRFKTPEVSLLQKRLERDPLAFVANNGGNEVFLMEAIFCGLSRDRKLKVNPARVGSWLDNEDHPPQLDGKDATRVDLVKAILYTIGRGKPKEEAEEYVKTLDEVFETSSTLVDEDASGNGVADGPVVSAPTTKSTTRSGTQPPSA